MKSTEVQLQSRGFLSDGFDLSNYRLITVSEKLEMLKSKTPKDRTLAARLLRCDPDLKNKVENLIVALRVETKLYPKLEIAERLVECRKFAVKPLLEELGRIGNNQHIQVPQKEFKKLSYPLPRDIAARILAKIGREALPNLLKFIKTAKLYQLNEAIDAIGFICFYDNHIGVFNMLKQCYQLYKKNDLLKWKLVRACSSFSESMTFLESEKGKQTNPRLLLEIDRSISLIKDR